MDAQTAKRGDGKSKRFSLRLKLNLVIVSAVLFSSLSVFLLAYYAHCRQIDRICFDEAERAALNVSKYFNSLADDNAVIVNFWNVILVQRIAIKPLRRLQDEAFHFTAGEKGYSAESIVKLDFHANDEIGDLYQEFHTMQERIVDYTHDLERVTAERERIRTELDLAGQIQRFPRLGFRSAQNSVWENLYPVENTKSEPVSHWEDLVRILSVY